MEDEIPLAGAEQDDDGRVEADKYVFKPAKKETVEEQIERQRKLHNYTNRLKEIVGQWPGDESIEDIIKDFD